MVDRSRVLEFIDSVVHGYHADAIRNFYHPAASMQENLAAPRCGRDQLVAHEEALLARIQGILTHPPRTLMVCVTLFHAGNGYAAVPTAEFDGDADSVIHEYDPFNP
jgi:hypothetical protein